MDNRKNKKMFDMLDSVGMDILNSIRNKKLRVSKGNVYIQTLGDEYNMPVSNFKVQFEKQFKPIYEMLEDLLEQEQISPSIMQDLYHLLNPYLEEIGVEPLMNLKRNFSERLKSDKKYLEYIKSLALENGKRYERIDERKSYIEFFAELGVFGEKEKVKMEYYVDAPISKIESVCKKENLDLKDRVILVAQVYQYERRLDEIKGNKKKKYNSRIVDVLNLIDGTTIADMYLQGGMNKEEFIRTKVQKSDILSLSCVGIMDFLETKNDEMPERLKITSKDLIKSYGRTLSGGSIYELVSRGYIELQDFIDVYEINKILNRVDFDKKDIFEDEELKAFYTPEKLIEMKKNGFTPRFIEKYLELEDFEKNPTIFRGKSIELVEEVLKDEKGEFQKDVLDFFDIGFCDLETAKEVITPKYIESEFEKGKLSKENIFDFYKKGFIDDDFIVRYYTDAEILEMCEKGEISKDCLKAIKDVDNIIQAFCDEKLETQDIISLYFKSNSFRVKDLSDALELSEIETDISAYIDETTPFEKIKELFSNLLIDYSSILRLKNQGIISDEQFLDIKKTLDTKEFFEEIRNGKKYTVVTSRQNESVERTRPIVSKVKENEDFSDEMKLLSTILERNVEDEDYGLIESINSKGRPTSLDNYRIFGNEKLDEIIILQKSKKGNAVFVMTAQQMMYFLKGKENEKGEFEVQDRMKDKAYLKTIEGVEVVEHSKFFGRNLIEACSRVSEKVSEKMKVSEKKYRDDVAEMVKDMLDKYLMDKGKSR